MQYKLERTIYMFKMKQCLTGCLLFLFPICVHAQLSVTTNVNPADIKAAQAIVDEEQKVFRDFLMVAPLDDNMKKELQRFGVNDVNNIQTNLQYQSTASKEKRAMGIRSLAFFMKELKLLLSDQKYDEFKTADIVKKYKQTLNDLLSKNKKESFEKNFKGIGWRSSQLLANTFWEFDEKKQMTDISAYKRVVKTPEYIFSFLEGKPGFYYTDSMVLFMARNNPQQLLSYLQKNNNEVTKAIRDNKNVYVQQLVNLLSGSLASEVAPFTEQLVNNELTAEEIISKRKNVTEYYQLLVNTIMANEQKKEAGIDAKFQKALRNALYERSLDFYVKKVNELHNSSDAVRFQSVQSLRPQDLYYIIVSADEEMYTSTYLGLYKRLMNHFSKDHADSLFSFLRYDKFRKFMRIAATYNTLTDFLHRMPAENSRELVHLFISDIEDDDEDEAVGDATDIADAFITLSKDPELNGYVKEELHAGLKNSHRLKLYQGIRLYSILLRVYELVNIDQESNDLSANYKTLPFSSLKDKNGNLAQLVVFYGDDDGKSSFNSFMSLFKDKSQWEVAKNNEWVTIQSLKGQPLKIFANLPLDNEEGKDLIAQHSLVEYLKQQSIEPSILIHRGHSYHLPNTLKLMQPYMKFAVLGSCGGYKNMKKIIGINPDIHIIASKQVGSMAVNDPLLNNLYNELLQGNNIDWVSFWANMNETFKGNAATQKLFEEYVPPYKNVSSFVVKLYTENGNEIGRRTTNGGPLVQRN